MKTFVEQLKESLEDYLDPFLDEGVYIDESRLKPGYLYREELASAICHSICMIVVYTPKYIDDEKHPYCLLEYRAMERIEEKRIELLGGRINNAGMIIPIIFRGEIKDMPSNIKDRIQCCDFSKFTTASPHIKEDPEYIAKIETIVKIIHDYYRVFKENDIDPCCDCHSFSLLSKDDVKPWEIKSNKPKIPFPGRGAK